MSDTYLYENRRGVKVYYEVRDPKTDTFLRVTKSTYDHTEPTLRRERCAACHNKRGYGCTVCFNDG